MAPFLINLDFITHQRRSFMRKMDANHPTQFMEKQVILPQWIGPSYKLALEVLSCSPWLGQVCIGIVGIFKITRSIRWRS